MADAQPSLPATDGTLRQAILFRLRQGGPASPDALAADLGASRSGVLQQLRALEAAGHVSRSVERHGVGRPRHRYDLTPEAQARFPADYRGLAEGLLAAIDAVGGPELVERVLAARGTTLAGRVEHRLAGDEVTGDGAPLETRVRELAVFQSERGYLAVDERAPDGSFRIRQHNCAIHHVAAARPEACAAELDLYRQVLGPDVVRETHIPSGDRCCTYRIDPADPD